MPLLSPKNLFATLSPVGSGKPSSKSVIKNPEEEHSRSQSYRMKMAQEDALGLQQIESTKSEVKQSMITRS